MSNLLNVTFVSEWVHDTLVKTSAKFNWDLGEVTDIEASPIEIDGMVTRQFIEFEDGTELDLDEEAYNEDGKTIVGNAVVLSVGQEERGYVIAEDDNADCGVEGCTSSSYLVYWQNGEKTVCCQAGLDSIRENTYHILG